MSTLIADIGVATLTYKEERKKTMKKTFIENLTIEERREMLLNSSKAVIDSFETFLSDRTGDTFGGSQHLNHCVGLVHTLKMMIHQLNEDDIEYVPNK